MYYDIEVRLTQGWFTYQYDLRTWQAAQDATVTLWNRRLVYRIVRHCATV